MSFEIRTLVASCIQYTIQHYIIITYESTKVVIVHKPSLFTENINRSETNMSYTAYCMISNVLLYD